MVGSELSRPRALISIVTAITSFCGLAYQQILALTLTDSSGDLVLSQALSLAAFLLGMGIGTGGLFSRGRKLSLTDVELRLALLGTLSVPLFQILEIALKFFWASAPALVLIAFALPWITAIGFLTGLEIPLLKQARSDLSLPRLLSLSYFGALLAMLTTATVLLPMLDLTLCALAIGVLNLSVAVIWHFGERSSPRALIFFSLLIFTGAHAAIFVEALHLKAIYARPRFSSWSNIASDWRILTRLNSPLRIRSLYQWIDLVPPEFSANVQGGQDFFLFLDRKIQLNANHSERYHQSLVEGAINLLGIPPQRVLILGGGDGALLPELLKNPSVRSVDLVEIDAKVLELAHTQKDLRQLNGGALENPKVHVHVADGFSYLRNQAGTYDLILIDLPYPSNYDLSLLFTREFYALTRRRLNANGLMAFDFPTQSRESPALAILLHTLKAAGFEKPFGFGGEDFFIAAARDSRVLKFDLPALFPRVGNSTLLNLISRENEITRALGVEAPVNSLFFPQRFATAGEIW